MNTCAWCVSEFQPKVSYQIYCSTECRNDATKAKIAERYQLNKIKNRSSKSRKCAGGCGSTLSMYNNNNFCNSCMVNEKKVKKTLKELKNLCQDE